jgi:hypothetical protein
VPYLFPHPEGSSIRCNRAGITGESRGGEGQLHGGVIQPSVFAAETRHHRIDHWNPKLGQRAAAKRHLSGNLCRVDMVGLSGFSNLEPPIGMSELRKYVAT